MIKDIKNQWWGFSIIFLASLILFFPSLNYYFFQDDWFVLNWVQSRPWHSFFEFRTDIIYWRPLSMPIFFAVNRFFFGLNHQWFHIMTFIIFGSLIFCVYQLFLLLINNRRLALLTSFLYAVWPIHFISLSWFSTASYIIGPLFQCLSFIFFLKFTKNKKFLLILISFISFFLALASTEMTIVLPFIILSWGVLIKKENYLKFLLPFIIFGFVYFLLRFVVFPIPAKDQYQIHFNHQIIYNFVWYLGWAFGLPEAFKSLIFLQLPTQSIKVITQFWQITLPFTLLVILAAKIIFTGFVRNFPHLIFAISWLVIGLIPLITLIHHSYPIYLSFAGLGILYLIAISLKKQNQLYWLSFCLIWLIASFSNLQFTRATHWVRNEQAISKAYVLYTKSTVPAPQGDAIFLFRPADINFSKKHNFVLVETEDNIRQALNGDDAMKVIYKNQNLKSIFLSSQQNINFPDNYLFYEISPKGNQ